MNNYIEIGLFLIINYTLSASIDFIYFWTNYISLIFGLLYVIFTTIYLYRIIVLWSDNHQKPQTEFWHLSTELALKNYNLIKEYRTVYQKQYDEVVKKCIENNKNNENYIKYILENDPVNKMDSPLWVLSCFDRITQYMKLSYYLSLLNPEDEIIIKQNIVYVNIKTESILNKRNRKLELVLNSIPKDHRNDLLNIWDKINKNTSDKILTIVPCKWILNEYKNIFNNIYKFSTPRDINFSQYESMIYKMTSTLLAIFKKDLFDLPSKFIEVYDLINRVFCTLLNNLVAVNIIYSFFYSFYYISVLTITLTLYYASVYTSKLITDMFESIKRPSYITIDNIDNRIESILDEMKILSCD